MHSWSSAATMRLGQSRSTPDDLNGATISLSRPPTHLSSPFLPSPSPLIYPACKQTTTATLDSPEWTLTKSEIDLETGLPRTVYRKTGLKPDSWSNG